MTVPMNRGTDSVSRNVYALIFNGITRASVVTTKLHDGFMPLSERERFAEAVYAELAAGGIEFRLGGLAMLARVVGTPPADPRQQARAADPHAHACVSCSPDGVLIGPGCGTCRQTGMDQTPCMTPGHQPQCPHGCCGGPRKPEAGPDPDQACAAHDDAHLGQPCPDRTVTAPSPPAVDHG